MSEEQVGEEFGIGPGESSDQTGEQPKPGDGSVEKEFWENPEKLGKAYKELKSVTDKLSEQMKEHGGLESLVEDRQLLETILADQRVQKAIDTQEEVKEEPGFVPENEEQRKALEFLDKYIDGKLKTKEAELLEKILPAVVELKTTETQRQVDSNLGTLAQYCQEEGLPPWKELESEMTAIHENFVKKGVVPKGAGASGGLEYLKMLYFGALTAKPDRVLQVAKGIVSKESDKAKALATAKSGSPPSVEGATQVKSVADAFKAAKQKHGMA